MPKPAPFATDTFPWVQNNMGDDFTCRIDPYILRVERIDMGMWSWRVYYEGRIIRHELIETTNSKYRAIGLAEGIYMGRTAKAYDEQ